jgi:hypothetical protein
MQFKANELAFPRRKGFKKDRLALDVGFKKLVRG